MRILLGGLVFAALMASRTLAAPSPDNATAYGTPCPYPETARTAGTQGDSGIVYGFGSDGSISVPRVALSSGDTELDQAAAACVARWREPSNGKPGKGRVLIRWTIPAGSGHPPPSGRIAPWPHICLNEASSLSKEIEGTTVVSFTIKTDGRISDLKLSQSSGNEAADRASIDCARMWRYGPAKRDGVPVEVPWRAKIIWSYKGCHVEEFEG